MHSTEGVVQSGYGVTVAMTETETGKKAFSVGKTESGDDARSSKRDRAQRGSS